jgi:MazG family protein
MAPSLVEEAHEMVEAIEAGDERGTLEEGGDLLLVVALICRIAQDEGRFDMAQAARAVGDKLLRRHPHVFGEVVAQDASGAIESWEAVKAAERRERDVDASALAGVPRAMPALQRAFRLGQKAVAAGFRWDSAEGAMRKVEEEVREVREAFGALGDPGRLRSSAVEPPADEARARLAAELGDLFLAGAQLAVYLDLDPERVARAAAARFEVRFRDLERDLGGDLRERSLDELMAAWARAKAGAAREPDERG